MTVSLISSDAIDTLFGSTYAFTSDNMDSLAATILGQGIDYFEDENYDDAIRCFKQAAALSPQSENAFNAYDYMGQAYIELEDTESAIEAYEEGIKAFSTTYYEDDTLYVALGDLYLQEGELDKTIAVYEKAIAIDPNNAESQYSLAQAYLENGDTDEAYEHFKRVTQISPNDPAGYYGLGEVARAEGDLAQAVTLFNKAIRLDRDFELAYRDLGYTYADQGDFVAANEQLSILEANDSDYVSDLEDYIAQVTQPEIAVAYSSDGFDTSLGPGTEVSDLNSNLTEADTSKLFSMTITFSKEMDVSSVVSSKNWSISRATFLSNGGVYNYGLTVSSSEASINSTPAYVTFDEDTNSATVYFFISQNEDADATIDPNHIVFKFSGVDTYGNAMDSSADEYSGFSGIA